MKPRFCRVFCQRKHRSTLRILKGILLHVGMKWEHWVLRMREVTAEMDKGIMVADSFRSEQECCAELALAWKIKDRSSSTPTLARPSLPFEVGNMDLIGPIDPPSLKGHKYILCLVDQHTRWGEARPVTSLSAK
ncbi:retrovirus-related Pol polyprotein from transposon opus, partial [Trichonephila clavipes]